MTLEQIYQDIDFLLNTTANSYPTPDKLNSVNRWYMKVFHNILQSSDDWDIQANTGTINLVAGQQSYSLASLDALRIKRVEVSYDGSNWYQALPYSVSESSIDNSASSIASNFFKESPYYEIIDDEGVTTINLYPIPDADVTGGLKIWFTEDLPELTIASDVPRIATPFHRILSLGAAYDFALANGMDKLVGMLRQEIEQLMAELRQFYGKRVLDRVLVFKPSNISYE